MEAQDALRIKTRCTLSPLRSPLFFFSFLVCLIDMETQERKKEVCQKQAQTQAQVQGILFWALEDPFCSTEK